MPVLTPCRIESSHTVHLVGVDPVLRQQIDRQAGGDLAIEVLEGVGGLFRHLEHGGAPLEAVLLGMIPEEAVRVAQRICAQDKCVPVMILCPPAALDGLRRNLMFSPLLGREVMPWSIEDLDVLPEALCKVIDRRRKHLEYQDTLARTQIRLEKLPLLRPEATHYLDQLLDCAPIGVVTVDLVGRILTLNRQAQETLEGLARNPLGRLFCEFFPPVARERWQALQAQCLAGGASRVTETLLCHGAAGNRCHVEVTLTPLAYRTGQRGAMVILQDVTARVEAEQERQQAEEELRLHVRVLRRFHEISSSEAVGLHEKFNQVLSLGCQQFGLPVGLITEIWGRDLKISHAVGNDPAYAVGNGQQLAQTYCGQTARSDEPLIINYGGDVPSPDGVQGPCCGLEAYIGARIHLNGVVEGTLCFHGVPARKRLFTEADRELVKLISRWVGNELQRKEAQAHMRKLSSALEQAADAVIIAGRNRDIEYVNSSFESLTGYSKQEVIGQKTHVLRSGVHDASFYDTLWKAITAGKAFRGVLVNRKKDGSLYHEQRTISPLKDEHGHITHFISTGHDITELVEAQRQHRLHQAELVHVGRLSTLGEMTSGIAHELNQPLCAITTFTQTCLRILDGDTCTPEQLQYGLRQVLRQADHAGQIFRRLRNFARKGDMHQRPFALADIINEVAIFIRAEAGQNLVKLQVELAEHLPQVSVDPIQIEQVLLNLVRNAMDAVVEREADDRRILIAATVSDQRHVVVNIKDSGHGCAPDVVDRLFEPFMTTKPEGLGVGLGISQSIIEAHQGRLWLAENSPKGATFCFSLPPVEISR